MKKLLISTALLASSAFAASITVDPASTAQKVVGFGAGAAYYQSWITAMSTSMQKDFYDTAFTGLNLSLLRLGNWKQEDTTSIAADVAIVKAGKQRLGNRLKIEMSSWSAPARLKPSGSVNGSVNGQKIKKQNTLKTSSSDPYGKFVYSEFAHWWKTSLQSYEQMGITPDYISLQNEPDMEADYEETLFDPTESGEVAGYKQALQAVRDSISTLANPPKNRYSMWRSRAYRPCSKKEKHHMAKKEIVPTTKSGIMVALAEAAGITKKQAVAVYEKLLDLAVKGAKQEEKGYMLPGLGKLVKKQQAARTGRNPATGETIKIKAKKVVKFRLAKACKDAVLAK